MICCFTYLCIHWLILVCALPRGELCSNQLTYPARPLGTNTFKKEQCPSLNHFKINRFYLIEAHHHFICHQKRKETIVNKHSMMLPGPAWLQQGQDTVSGMLGERTQLLGMGKGGLIL